MTNLVHLSLLRSRFFVWIMLAGSLTMSSPSFSQSGAAQEPATTQSGPSIGDTAPAFTAHDQFGKEQNNKSVTGPNGTVLLFFRSADW
jgi:hypothetical protein